MFLELSEVFVCPACRPAQGLIVLVDAIEERRVREGHLGCPECEMRVPIRDRVLRFDEAGGGEPADARSGPDAPAPWTASDAGAGEGASGPALLAGVGEEEAATRLAALLGADRAEGCLLLGPGLGALAAPLARLAEKAEVLALAAGAGTATAGDGSGDGVSRAVGVDPRDLPFVTGRLAGVALLGPSRGGVREAVRVLQEGGRAVIVEPSPEARKALDEEPVRVAAADEAALVGVREPGVAPARS